MRWFNGIFSNSAGYSKMIDGFSDMFFRNKSLQTPYCVCLNKEAKNTYRRFRAKYPDMFDYNKAQVEVWITIFKITSN